MSIVNPVETAKFEQRLRRRQEELIREIDEAIADKGRGDLTEIVGRVRDPGEDSVADLVVTTNLAMLDRDVNELREVEAALRRIREGTYGQCEDCGDEIGRERLEVYPTAKRCIDCQQRYEGRLAGGRDPSPSL
jgi:DnaK suppressor protein